METQVHIMNVGQGSMSLIKACNGKTYIFDCNITSEREADILGYVASQIGWGGEIEAFICSHRDADHMRGIQKLHQFFPIRAIWDSDHPGTTTGTTEYAEYMNLRRNIGGKILQRQT